MLQEGMSVCNLRSSNELSPVGTAVSPCSSSPSQLEINPDSRVVQEVSLANCQTGYEHKEDSKAILRPIYAHD